MDSRGSERSDLNGKENTAGHDSGTNVHILAKRKLKRDGVEERWEQGVVSGSSTSFQFARPEQPLKKRMTEQHRHPTAPSHQNPPSMPQPVAAPPALPAPPTQAPQPSSSAPHPSQPLPCSSGAGPSQLAAPDEQHDASDTGSASEDEVVYQYEYDPDVDAPKLQYESLGPQDMAQLQAVLRKVLHAAAASAEATAPQLQPAACEALVEATCNNIASMALTPALTGQLRREMLTLEAAATAACRQSHDRTVQRELAEMQERHVRWREGVQREVAGKLEAWEGPALARELVERARVAREEWFARVQRQALALEALVKRRSMAAREGGVLSAALVEEYGDMVVGPPGLATEPKGPSRAKAIAAIQGLLAAPSAEDTEELLY